jgi:hypothetical protein
VPWSSPLCPKIIPYLLLRRRPLNRPSRRMRPKRNRRSVSACRPSQPAGRRSGSRRRPHLPPRPPRLRLRPRRRLRRPPVPPRRQQSSPLHRLPRPRQLPGQLLQHRLLRPGQPPHPCGLLLEPVGWMSDWVSPSRCWESPPSPSSGLSHIRNEVPSRNGIAVFLDDSSVALSVNLG